MQTLPAAAPVAPAARRERRETRHRRASGRGRDTAFGGTAKRPFGDFGRKFVGPGSSAPKVGGHGAEKRREASGGALWEGRQHARKCRRGTVSGEIVSSGGKRGKSVSLSPEKKWK